MSYIVLKFGGSSLADAEKVKNVSSIIKSRNNDEKLIIIVSALNGVTNDLYKLADLSAKGDHIITQFDLIILKHIKCIEELSIDSRNFLLTVNKYFDQLKDDLSLINKKQKLSLKSLDKIYSYGELLSASILAKYLSSVEIKSDMLDSRLVVKTNNNYGFAEVQFEKTYDNIKKYFNNVEILQIVTGFIGSTENNETTTIGRNGSDYTASLFGAAMNAKQIEIWTDVNGVYSANPNIIRNAKVIPFLNYEEAMELAHAGAEILFPPTIIPALSRNIPIRVKNTFKPNETGTFISIDRKRNDNNVVGVSSLSNISLVRLQGAGMVGMKGLIARIFSVLAEKDINIILVAQSFSEHSICFAINPESVDGALKILKFEFNYEIENQNIDKIEIESNLSLIAVVGEGMRHNPGVSGRVFSTLGKFNINVIAISQGSSERNISFIISDNDIGLAVRVLHMEFFEKNNYDFDIYLLGVGLIGSKLLDIISKINPSNYKIKRIGSSNKMLISNNIDPTKAKNKLIKNGVPFDFEEFIGFADNQELKNRVFIDCTSSEDIAKKYINILDKGISIITANKIANTLEQEYYSSIREKAKNKNLHFFYETNVGAGLPVIKTLRSLISTGDKILKIQGILSGTLSYLFNSFNGKKSFSSILNDAKSKGFTEPDPRIDLSGIDVARKILILARECGASLELSDVKIENLIPEKLDRDLSIEKFLYKMNEFDNLFLDKYNKAKSQNRVLRYIASWDGNNAIVSLKSVGEENPFYNQNGRENFILFKTERYRDVPLIIKGHGAGSSVTAAGILNDLNDCINLSK